MERGLLINSGVKLICISENNVRTLSSRGEQELITNGIIAGTKVFVCLCLCLCIKTRLGDVAMPPWTSIRFVWARFRRQLRDCPVANGWHSITARLKC